MGTSLGPLQAPFAWCVGFPSAAVLEKVYTLIGETGPFWAPIGTDLGPLRLVFAAHLRRWGGARRRLRRRLADLHVRRRRHDARRR